MARNSTIFSHRDRKEPGLPGPWPHRSRAMRDPRLPGGAVLIFLVRMATAGLGCRGAQGHRPSNSPLARLALARSGSHISTFPRQLLPPHPLQKLPATGRPRSSRGLFLRDVTAGTAAAMAAAHKSGDFLPQRAAFPVPCKRCPHSKAPEPGAFSLGWKTPDKPPMNAAFSPGSAAVVHLAANADRSPGRNT